MNWWHLSSSPKQKVNIVTETEQTSPKKRGGTRPGAGRKRSTPPAIHPPAETRRASVVRTAENAENGGGHTALVIIAKLEADFTQEAPGLLSRLLELAHGATQVTGRYELAGLITLDDMESDGEGKSWKVKTYPFSHLPKDQMVLVSRTITQLPPDRTALTYLFDRVMGKPADRKDMMTADPGNAAQGPSRLPRARQFQQRMDFEEKADDWNMGRAQGRGGLKAWIGAGASGSTSFGLDAHDRAVGQGRERLPC